MWLKYFYIDLGFIIRRNQHPEKKLWVERIKGNKRRKQILVASTNPFHSEIE